MSFEPTIAPVAALLADPGRASIVSALLEGRGLPAGELARIAGISPQTASMHLAKLVEGGFLRVHSQGRHRYYAIANADIAHAVETLGAISPLPQVRSLRQSLDAKRLSAARTCYDHLAGGLAVGIADALIERGDCKRHDAGLEL
ncbi:MAG: winged helix-turn-helix domain-containing protein, partial [Candidatus Baltobacteraceae bacterium]